MEATTHTPNPTPAEKLGRALGVAFLAFCVAIALAIAAWAFLAANRGGPPPIDIPMVPWA
jgi:hypothetical protein